MLQCRNRILLLIVLLWSCSVVDSFVDLHRHSTATFSQQHETATATTRVPTKLHDIGRFFSELFGGDEGTSAVAVAKVLKGRRTVNNFETTQVSEDVVHRAIEAALYAPCHKMTEPWRFILLGDETVSKIASLNAAEIAKKDPAKGEKKKKRWEAIPGWCVITSAKSDGGLQEREDYAATCCAVQNFMLSLWAEGVGTKWTTGPITRTAEFAGLCGIDPKAEDVVGCIWYGYAANNEETIPAPKRRKSVVDVTSRRP